MPSLTEINKDIQEHQGLILDPVQMREFALETQVRGIELLQASGVVDALEGVKNAANEGRLFDKTEYLDMDFPEERRSVKLAKLNNLNVPDPESKYIKLPGGNVAIELGWKYRQEPSMFRGGQRRMVYDSLRVTVQPVSEDIVVSGNLNELIPRGTWSNPSENNNNALLSAIKRALKSPGKQAEPILERVEF